MGNVDWDTANMVIRIFQSYYPETLGHAVIWNAPTLFSGMWKIVKGMLDPAVKEKIAFASTQKEISEVGSCVQTSFFHKSDFSSARSSSTRRSCQRTLEVTHRGGIDLQSLSGARTTT